MYAFGWMDSSLFRADDFDRDTEGEIIWVAISDNEPVGFISVWEPENFIHNLFVHPKVIRQGFGSALLDECLNHIGRPAVLKCASKNIRARDFYVSKGWGTVSEADGPDGKYLLMHFDEET
jgi:GNAT superfamily N-acetyltransferase